VHFVTLLAFPVFGKNALDSRHESCGTKRTAIETLFREELRMLLRTLVLAGLLLGLSGASALAQPRDNTQPPAGGDRGARGDRGDRADRGNRNFDPAEMRERMLDGIRNQLQLGDDEWDVLKPKLERVIDAQREVRGGMMGMAGGFGGRGGRGGQDGNRPVDPPANESELAKATRELRAAIRDENATTDLIKQKLEAYRTARKAAEAELETARQELKAVLTPRQEAQFVLTGMLE
jgi:Spy/CpxP family protein refolding chaperone